MVIFGAGVITGALVVRFTPPIWPPQHANSRPFEGSPGGMRLDFLRRMQASLNLTAEQRDQIDKILKQSQERTHKLMEPVSPQLHQELVRAKAEFRAALTPSQQLLFDEMIKQQQQRFKERRSWFRPSESSLTNSTATNSI